MKKSTFLVFTMPSFIMMTLFIALPLLIVLIQSFQFNQDVLETIERENCDPFGCKTETITVPVLDENGNMKILSPPTADGTYTLKVKVAQGKQTYSWT